MYSKLTPNLVAQMTDGLNSLDAAYVDGAFAKACKLIAIEQTEQNAMELSAHLESIIAEYAGDEIAANIGVLFFLEFGPRKMKPITER